MSLANKWMRKKTSFCNLALSNTQWVSLVTFKSDALWDSLANVCSNSTICKFLFSFAWVSWCKFSSSLANSSNFSWCCLQSEEGRKFPCWYRKAEERVVTNKNHLELNLSGEYFDLLCCWHVQSCSVSKETSDVTVTRWMLWSNEV